MYSLSLSVCSVCQFLPGEYILHILRMFSAAPEDLWLAPAYEARLSRPRGPLLTGTSLIYIAIEWTNTKVNIMCVCVCVFGFSTLLESSESRVVLAFSLCVCSCRERREQRLLDLLFLFSSLLFSVWSLAGPLSCLSLSLTHTLSRYSRMLTEHKHTRA